MMDWQGMAELAALEHSEEVARILDHYIYRRWLREALAGDRCRLKQHRWQGWQIVLPRPLRRDEHCMRCTPLFPRGKGIASNTETMLSHKVVQVLVQYLFCTHN